MRGAWGDDDEHEAWEIVQGGVLQVALMLMVGASHARTISASAANAATATAVTEAA